MTVVDENYTGHVEPQTAARRNLPAASIVKVSVGPMDNNAYLVTCSQTGETLLIDAANDAEILLELIDRFAPKLSLIVTSHQHQDHWLALSDVASSTGAPTAAHELDAEAAAGQAGPDPGQRRHDQDRQAVVRRHPSAGTHAGIGRTGTRRSRRRDPPVHRRLPVSRRRRQNVAGGRLREAARRRHDRVFDVYADSTVVYPGHGDDTTLGTERPHLAEWKERGW